MGQVFNFSAGPAVLPKDVLQQVKEELLDWRGTGKSVMEMSHRSPEFTEIAEQAEADLREILAIPKQYRVLFLPGGATAQFAMVPMNLCPNRQQAAYVNTGLWSKKAIAEAKLFTDVAVVASSEADNFTTIPPMANWEVPGEAAYLHYTANETIGGVEFHYVPDVGAVPLVSDMSSTLLSRPVDIERFGIIYASAQKNLGPSGVTVVIVREDLIDEAAPGTPSMFSYRKHADAHSCLNTPPTFNWYVAGLVFAWIKAHGGLANMAMVNKKKADKLYAAIDDSEFYHNPVDPDCRSWMNIPFRLNDPELESVFLRQAAEQGLTDLKGHRSVGGIRVSCYNAMPETGIDVLVEFMCEFAAQHG